MANDFSRQDGLSRIMAGRYHAQHPRYRGRTLQLLSLLGRGKNNYDSVSSKSDTVNAATGVEREYYRTLTENFKINVKLDADAVAKAVCNVRARYGYPPFIKRNVQKQCVDELYKVFIVKESNEPGAIPTSKKHKEYAPLFSLMAD